jgi:hypothetical protein
MKKQPPSVNKFSHNFAVSGEHWNVGQKKDFRSKADALELAEKTLQATLGADWLLVIDVDSFGEHTHHKPTRIVTSQVNISTDRSRATA